MAFRNELIDELISGYQKPEEIIGENGLLKQLSKAILERALNAELTQHLGYEKHAVEGKGSGNSRNGFTRKMLSTDLGAMDIEVPRDRNGAFEPQIVRKGQRRFSGFDDKILSMYARGMSVRDIQGHLKDIYNVDVSPDLISSVTDEVIDEMREWQSRPLEPVYAIVYFDAMWLKIREEGRVVNKAAYIALGIKQDGLKDILGIWIEKEEGAKFWLKVISEIQSRGVQDILIACVDGLKGFPEAIEAVFPKTFVQSCIVHMIRNSLKFVPWKERRAVAADLRNIYTAPSEDAALKALDDFSAAWDSKYPMIKKSWTANWTRIRTMFDFPDAIRKVIYTTNAIESLNFQFRKATKTRGTFPSDEAATKLLFMTLQVISKKWTITIQSWGAALHQLAIIFPNRVSLE